MSALGAALLVASLLLRFAEVASALDWLAGLVGLSHSRELRFLLSPAGWYATLVAGLVLLLLALLWPDAPRIAGEILEVYTHPDGASNCNLLVRLRVVLEVGDPVTVVDVSLRVITGEGDTLVGQLDRGDLSGWIVVSERRQSSPLLPDAYTVRRRERTPDPLLPKISAEGPLAPGVHREGWVVFKLPSPNLASWEVHAEIQRARSVTLTIVDALRGTHRIAITQPWSQPNRVIHRSWLPG